MNTNNTIYVEGKVPYFKSVGIEKTGIVKHCFSTRLGGVSTGEYSSMNLTFTRNDNPDNVRKNFELIAETAGMSTGSMVYAMQTHTVNVMEVTEKHKGMGITAERNFSDVDGLVTDIPGITLVTSHADCVPLYFVDPVRHAIGLSHSGWRGTVNNIALNTVKKLHELYGCRPENLVCFIGPSICSKCYEISEDVADEFKQAYGNKVYEGILFPEAGGKYHLDLWKANYINLLNAGVRAENTSITEVCTCCNSNLLFSHRASGGRRGGMCAFLTLQSPNKLIL